MNTSVLNTYSQNQTPVVTSCYRLNLDKANTDNIVHDQVVVLSGVFDIFFKFSVRAEDNQFAPLIGGDGTTRIFISPSRSEIWITFDNGSNSVIGGLSLSLNTEYELRVYRGGDNIVYYELNGGAPTTVRTTTSDLTFQYVGRSQTRYFDGYITEANYGGDYNFQLNEGSSAAVNSELGSKTGAITTTQDLTYINNTMWELCP